MKKSFFAALALAFAMLFATPVHAQKVKIGIKAGLNINSFSFKNFGDNFSSQNRAGFFVGPQLDVTTPLAGLGADIAALYEHKTMGYSYLNEEGAEVTGKKTMQYISVPLNIKYSLGIGSKFSIYAATGPQVSFNISGKSFGEGVASMRLKDADFSWNFGAGFTILSHYRIGYNFNLGITDQFGSLQGVDGLGDAVNVTKGIGKSRTHQVSFTYVF